MDRSYKKPYAALTGYHNRSVKTRPRSEKNVALILLVDWFHWFDGFAHALKRFSNQPNQSNKQIIDFPLKPQTTDIRIDVAIHTTLWSM
ncbi:hypothetical protein DSCO28_05220 [Desulfosarcina ovata subsp. sediminis]|uniref:Uncharacterized protein n=2 Tax=Desulfosarcina ovata TaxID=83564 RepID=A0A5K8A416_9BACT|nr:hypothetical protein DSCO28_05220 [Desulfosarcina ovata subsp. sediminis]BBO87259.1 hypothetical protein DSCOOX_04390 [Desulfosarcina ovata subsp. ovata]